MRLFLKSTLKKQDHPCQAIRFAQFSSRRRSVPLLFSQSNLLQYLANNFFFLNQADNLQPGFTARPHQEIDLPSFLDTHAPDRRRKTGLPFFSYADMP
jgi:hypothetical protein